MIAVSSALCSRLAVICCIRKKPSKDTTIAEATSVVLTTLSRSEPCQRVLAPRKNWAIRQPTCFLDGRSADSRLDSLSAQACRDFVSLGPIWT